MVGVLRVGSPKIMAFGEWTQRALDYATVHPTSPLARSTAIFDGYTDEIVAGMFKGLPVGEHVFGGHDYAPSTDEELVTAYLSRSYSQSGN